MTTTPGPRTKAGKRLLDRWGGIALPPGGYDPTLDEWRAAILAIEAEAIKGCIESTADHMTFLDNRAAEARADVDGLRDWQKDLLSFDEDGLTLPQVVAHLLGVKSIDLREHRDDEGMPTGETDRRWRVQYFGGTYGRTLHDEMAARERSREARADVDGLVAQIAELGWTGLPQYAIAYAAAIRDVLALLAGKEDE